MATKYKLYLFDLDGTLLDSDKMLIEAFHTMYKLYKPEYKIDDSHILELSGPQIKDSLLNEFPNQDQELMYKEWLKYSQLYSASCLTLFPGARSLLEKLKSKGINFAIITNKNRTGTNFTFKQVRLEDLDIYCLCAEEAGKLKPAPDGIFKAMEHFNIKDKSEVLYIGDTDFDYFTSKNAGVDFGFVSWSPRALPEGAKIDLVINDFESWSKEF